MAKTVGNLGGLMGGNTSSGGAIPKLWGSVFGTPQRNENPLEGLYPTILEQANKGTAGIEELKPKFARTQEDVMRNIRLAAKQGADFRNASVAAAGSTQGRSPLEEALQRVRGLNLVGNTPSLPSDEELFQLMNRRSRESLGQQLAASGMGTSGRGIAVQTQNTNELATQFGEKAFDRNLARKQLIDNEKIAQETLFQAASGKLADWEQGRSSLMAQANEAAASGNTQDANLYYQAAQGMAVLQAMPEQMRTQIIAAMMGANAANVTTPAAQGILPQITQAIGAIKGGGGGGGAKG